MQQQKFRRYSARQVCASSACNILVALEAIVRCLFKRGACLCYAVTFKIGCSQADGLQAVDVSADIQVEETPIEVLQGKHKKLYNMLLKAFAERVKTTIEEQLKVVIAASTSVLKAK